MYVEEDDAYERFNKEDINNLNELNYNFVLSQRFVNVKDNNGKHFRCQTPFLKVLKPVHVTLNKKKTIAKKYIILETNDDLDFNGQIGDFLLIINKIHEISQEKIKNHSLEWFNTEFDDIGLDIKVRRPIDLQKDNEFIRICIPKNKEIEDMVNTLTTEDYVLCNVVFKGLKVSNDYITEEWELEDFITQEKFNQLQSCQEYLNDNELVDKVSTLLDVDEQHDNEHHVDEHHDDEHHYDEHHIDEHHVEEQCVEEHHIEEHDVDEHHVEELEVKNQLLEDSEISIVEVNETILEDKMEVKKELILNTIEKSELVKKKKSKEKNNKKSINEKILENKLNRTSNNKEQPIKKHSKKIIFT
jgi:hypothetical protein